MSRDAMPEMRSEQPRKGCIWVRRYDSLGMERYLGSDEARLLRGGAILEVLGSRGSVSCLPVQSEVGSASWSPGWDWGSRLGG